jgi:hypothetical protein
LCGAREFFVRFANIFSVVFVGALAFGAAAAHADPEASSRAAKLSAALGGTLNSDIGEAGDIDHHVEFSPAMLRPGRSVEYRRRVALEMQMAAQSGASGNRAAPMNN